MEDTFFTFERETLLNENGNDYGQLYKIKCAEDRYLDAIQSLIVNEIGEDWYYNSTRSVWEQIRFEHVFE